MLWDSKTCAAGWGHYLVDLCARVGRIMNLFLEACRVSRERTTGKSCARWPSWGQIRCPLSA